MANALSVVLIYTVGRTQQAHLPFLGVCFAIGLLTGVIAVKDPVRIPFYNATNFSPAKMWAMYLTILGVLAWACFWLSGHVVLFSAEGNRLAQFLLAYLLGTTAVTTRPHGKARHEMERE